MPKQIARVRQILARWRGAASGASQPALEFDRRSAPDAPMDLVLRFATDSGPRTIVAAGVPLGLASDIAREMEKAGHFAQYIDHLPTLSLAERIKRKKVEKHVAKARRNPALDSRPASLALGEPRLLATSA